MVLGRWIDAVFGHADDEQFKIGMQALLAIVPTSSSPTAPPSAVRQDKANFLCPSVSLTASSGGQFRAQLCAIAGSLGRPLFIKNCVETANTFQLSAETDLELAHLNNQALHDQLMLELSAVFSFDGNDSKCDVLVCCAEMDDQLSRCALCIHI